MSKSSSGIVRRIDELGRVVIPMEYRKMFRLNVGDPVEIMTSENEEVILKKVGVESEYISNAKIALESVETGVTLVVSDKLRWRVGTGSLKASLIDKTLDAKIQSVLNQRKSLIEKIDSMYVCAEAIYSVETYGVMMAISNRPILENDVNTVKFLAKVIAKLTEKF